jgi:sec-independent protein translocase protein TatB
MPIALIEFAVAAPLKFGPGMFDLTSSKLLILGLVALIVVGPKDLPMLLRTIGKYVGMIRRHANEFRAQFDEAMREQELANLKSEMEAVKRDVETTVRGATSSVQNDIAATTRDIDGQLRSNPAPGWSDPLETLPADSHPTEPAAVDHAEPGHRINGATPPTAAPLASTIHSANPAGKAGA